MARSENSIDSLLMDVEKGTPEQARAAAITLGSMGAGAEEAAPDLVDHLALPYGTVTWAIVEALAAIASADEQVVDDLLDGIQDPDENIRWGSARALGLMGKAAEDTVEELYKLLRDPKGAVCWAAIRALEQIAAESDKALKCLIGHLQDTEHNEHILWGITTALGRLGPRAKPAEGILTKLVDEANRSLRWAAVESLQRIRRPD
ncbi:HEAT repeat domain-containing protein [bacterium]|nr:HEAT repeat domain-containing protein [bacterium]